MGEGNNSLSANTPECSKQDEPNETPYNKYFNPILEI